MTHTEYKQQDGVELNQALFTRLDNAEKKANGDSKESIEKARAQELAAILTEYGIEGVDLNVVLRAGGISITLLELVKKLQKELAEEVGIASFGCIVPSSDGRGIVVLDDKGNMVVTNSLKEAVHTRFFGRRRRRAEGVPYEYYEREPLFVINDNDEYAFISSMRDSNIIAETSLAVLLDLFRFERECQQRGTIVTDEMRVACIDASLRRCPRDHAGASVLMLTLAGESVADFERHMLLSHYKQWEGYTPDAVVVRVEKNSAELVAGQPPEQAVTAEALCEGLRAEMVHQDGVVSVEGNTVNGEALVVR